MPQRVFARLASVSERSLAKLEKGETPSDSMRRQLTEIARLQEALAKVMNAKVIGNWFLEPNPAFDGLKPLEAVERGEIDRIWVMIYELESGAAG
jgi:transcriptional regulator with XRE-family HTH domain